MPATFHDMARNRKVPELGETVESVRIHAEWVNQALASGQLEPAQAREMTQTGRTVLQAIKEKRQSSMLDDMRAWAAGLEQRRRVIDAVIAILHKRGENVEALIAEAEASLEPRAENN